MVFVTIDFISTWIFPLASTGAHHTFSVPQVFCFSADLGPGRFRDFSCAPLLRHPFFPLRAWACCLAFCAVLAKMSLQMADRQSRYVVTVDDEQPGNGDSAYGYTQAAGQINVTLELGQEARRISVQGTD